MAEREMHERWIQDNNRHLVESAYVELGYGRTNDFRRTHGLVIATKTIDGVVCMTHCRTIELGEVGRAVLAGDRGAAAMAEAIITSHIADLSGVLCFEHRSSSGNILTAVRQITIPPAAPGSVHAHVPGWEHVLFSIVGDAHGFSRKIRGPHLLTQDVRARIRRDYLDSMIAATVNDPGVELRLNPVAKMEARLDATGDKARMLQSGIDEFLAALEAAASNGTLATSILPTT